MFFGKLLQLLTYVLIRDSFMVSKKQKEVKRMLALLTECTILMLKLICEMYSFQRITYNEFISFAENKMQFLLENLNNFATEAERNSALDILNRCESLISQNDNRLMFPSFRSNINIVQ